MTIDSDSIRRRQVFFLNGFDPKGAGHFHRLFRDEAERQAKVSGVTYAVGQRVRNALGYSQWTVQRRDAEGADVTTRYHFLAWDDLARQHWARGFAGVLTAALHAYFNSTVSAVRHFSLAPKTIAALFYPAVVWSVFVFFLAGLLASVHSNLRDWLNGPVVLAAMAVIAGMAFWAAAKIEAALNTAWLLRIYAFASRWAADEVDGLEERIDRFARLVEQALEDPETDEVLMVGFSVGTMLAVATAANIIQGGRMRNSVARLSVLTLGHCLPLLGWMPKANRFRQALTEVGISSSIYWVDYSAPTDWGSFALVNPVLVCGQNPDPRTSVNPRHVLSPRFHLLFSPTSYSVLKKNKRRMHMQYLMATELTGQYDYFDITCGPVRLSQRFVSRPSP